MTDLNVLSKLKFSFLICFLLIFFSCNKNNSFQHSSSASEVDSIRIWISQSKLKEVDRESEVHLLNKAFNKAQSIGNDSLKCKNFAQLSRLLTKLNDSLLFRKVNANGLALATKTKNSTCRASLLCDLGNYFDKNVVRDSAYYYYVQANKIFTKLGDRFSSGRILNTIARIQNEIGDYTGSEITTIQAIEKLKPLSEYEQLYYSYNNLGDVTKLLNNYDKSLEYYEQALTYIKKANLGAVKELSHMNNVALVYQKMGQHQKAASYFTEVVNFDSLRYKNSRAYARTLSNLGYSYLKLNKMEDLPDLFRQAFKIQDSIKDIGGKSSTTLRVAEYLLLKKDTAAALVHLRESENYAVQASSNKTVLKILSLLSLIDSENAGRYTQEYVTLSDSLQNQERRLRDKFARIRFETDEVVAENELLAKQRQLMTGITLAILLLSVAAFVIISQRIKNQKLEFQQTQQAANQEIFNLMLSQSEKLEEGKQIEQKRISEELHDGVQGRLQGARMMLLGLNPRSDEEAVKERKRAILMLKEVQEEVRHISHELSHAAYQKIHNFILSLEDLKATISQSAGIKVNLNYAKHVDWDGLSGDIKINLYRIIQESIQNAVKHAACTNIDIDLKANTGNLHVSIADNGKGFIVKKGKKGIGMRNIASRVKKVNGTWEISSDLGQGTRVNLEIPLVEIDRSKVTVSEHKNQKKIDERGGRIKGGTHLSN